MSTKKLLMGAFCIMALAACKNDDDDNTSLNQTDRDFINMASYSNNAEVDAGQMAVSKGMNMSIHSFGQMMVTDHTMAETELQSTAQQVGMTAPQGLDAEHQALKIYLSALSGYTFDTAYIHSQVKDHQKTINLMQNEISNGSDQRLKNYANKYLPNIMMHYHMADSISRSL